MATIDTNKYIDFVRQTTSAASTDYAAFLSRLTELEALDCDVPRLLTAAVGMGAEAGEFTEIVKKIIFQGKPYTEENIEHLKIELGDILWYAAQACMALEVSFEDVMERNYKKLSARYPEGTFDVYRSENRAEGDL
jgi:NTP pyrophosphatase (non-canonical NTP hydrolase)